MKRESRLTASYQSALRQKDGTSVDARFECFDDSMVNFDKHCRLVLTFESEELISTASDFFAALDGVRQQLEPRGLIPVVNGAGRSNYPSGMARDMGMGLAVYRLRVGVKPSMTDLVQTFEADAVGELSTVSEQKEFYRAWLENALNA